MEIKQSVMEENEVTFSVDIPNAVSNEWICVKEFGTKAKAIAYARKHFGADENGMVSLISEY